MERIAVQSTDIAIVGYDPATQILEVTFRRGGVYQYNRIPSEVYEALMAADSHGTYFNQFIKDRFTCTKVV